MSAADGAADVSIREQLVARAIAAPSPPRESCRRANGTAQERRALDDRCSSTTESRNDAGDAWAGFDLGRGSLSRNASVRQPRRRASVQRRDRAAVRRRRGSLRAPRRGVRDRRTGLSQKILWVLPARYRKSEGPELAVTGRLNGIVRFRQWFPGAGVPGDPALYFPSNIAPPTAGCWTLTLTTGQLKARLIVLVRS